MQPRKVLCIVGLAAAIVAPLASTASAAAPTAAGAATRVVIPPVADLAVGANGTVKSTNWSGYAVSSASKFTDVEGSWVQPAATCTGASTQYASFWVGIDGYTSDSVEQLGTDSDCRAGVPAYSAWYEMYPAGSVNLPVRDVVKPGDALTATVTVSGSTVTLSLSSSEGWAFSIVKTASNLKQSSAEWIAEAPEICASTCSIAHLADFGQLTFTRAEAAAGGAALPISSFTTSDGPHRIIMTTANKATLRAEPLALARSGAGFTDDWLHI